jgi:AdoMet-dependent rRNA methyltransferase SPB1
LDDLKVLGKGDFKALLKWRTALREEVRWLKTLMFFLTMLMLPQLGLEVKTKHVDEFTEAVEVVDVADEDEQIQQEVCNYV